MADAPEERGGTHGGWDQIAETSQIFEAELIALRLRDAGIEAQVVDQTFHQEPLPNVRNFSVVRVLVKKDDMARARQALADGQPLPLDGESDKEPEV